MLWGHIGLASLFPYLVHISSILSYHLYSFMLDGSGKMTLAFTTHRRNAISSPQITCQGRFWLTNNWIMFNATWNGFPNRKSSLSSRREKTGHYILATQMLFKTGAMASPGSSLEENIKIPECWPKTPAYIIPWWCVGTTVWGNCSTPSNFAFMNLNL